MSGFGGSRSAEPEVRHDWMHDQNDMGCDRHWAVSELPRKHPTEVPTQAAHANLRVSRPQLGALGHPILNPNTMELAAPWN